MAVRQRRTAHRPYRRSISAARHLRPISADVRPPGADGQRLRRARHAHHRPRRGRGRRPGRNRRPLPCDVHPQLPRAGAHLRPVHAHRHRQPLAGDAGHVPRAPGRRLHLPGPPATVVRHTGAPVSARPLRGGPLPVLRPSRSARRSVRPVRAHVRSGGTPGAAFADHGQHRTRSPRDRALFLRPVQTAGRTARVAARRQDALAAQRAALRADPGGTDRVARPADHAGHGLGRVDSAARHGRQVHLRLVRRGDRVSERRGRVGAPPRRTRRVAALVGRRDEPARAYLQLHRQGQYSVSRHDVAGHAHRAPRHEPALRRAGQRIPEHVRPQVQQEPGAQHRHPGRAGPLSGRCVALRADRHRARGQRRGLHLGRLRRAREQRTGRQLGQPRQPRAGLRLQTLERRRARAGAAR